LGKYKALGSGLDRDYRNDLNANFEDIDLDIQTVTTEQTDNVLKTRKTLYGDVKGVLSIGYYSSVDGAFINHSGVSNWGSFRVYNGSQKNYVFENPYPAQVRIVQFDSNNVRISSSIISNGAFSVGANCVSFGVNARLVGSVPDSTATPFNTLDDIKNAIIRVEEGVTQQLTAVKKDINDKLVNIPVPIPGTEQWTTLSNTPTLGYYNSTTGIFNTGTNWKNFFVETKGGKKFNVVSPTAGTVRLIMFEDGKYISSSVIEVNTEFQIPNNCTHFAINIKLPNANPTSPTVSEFASADGLSVIGFIPSYENKTLLTQFNELKRVVETGAPTTGPLKILMIGNSFSVDAATYLYDIVSSAGLDVIIGVLYRGGEDLQGQWEQITSNLESYIYYKWTAQGYNSTPTTSVQEAVIDERWDIITLQQSSDFSGMYETFQPYLNNIINYIKGIATNAAVKFGLHMTWAYATDSTHAAFPNYNNNQLTMYNAIVGAYLQAMEETNIDILLPTGTAIQNARNNTYLQTVGQELTRDGYHMDYGIGRYITALVLFEVLFAGRNKTDIFTNVDFVPGNGGTKFLVYLSKLAAKHAVLNPFKITQF
jgi:Domain of unknown function (DUF4886)